MLLPAHDFGRIQIISIPDDFSEKDAMRRVTALIAEVQGDMPDWHDEDITAHLEDNGFALVDFSLGPTLG